MLHMLDDLLAFLHEWWTTSDSISQERRMRMAEETLMGREEDVIAAWRGRQE